MDGMDGMDDESDSQIVDESHGPLPVQIVPRLSSGTSQTLFRQTNPSLHGAPDIPDIPNAQAALYPPVTTPVF